MSDPSSRFGLAAYDTLGRLAVPLVEPYLSYRVRRRKEDPDRRVERYGRSPIARPGEGSLVWLHAASVGESAAVVPLIEAVIQRGCRVLMTTGTTTSAELVRERLGERVIHQFAPLDIRPFVRRFLDHWRPDLAITVESEIWPTTMRALADRNIPQILVNARLSDRSFRRWKAMPGLARTLFERYAHVIAQSEVDAERFGILGASRVSVAGNLKADLSPPGADGALLAHLRAGIGDRPVWAALSTHDGEESIAAEVHATLRRRRPDVLTVLVPRHADRGDTIARMLEDKGLSVARRSRGESPDRTTDILLGDTMGEMGLYLRLAPIAFVGKSLADQGGHNPLEAAMFGVGVLSGRYVQNFRESFQRLVASGGAKLVRDAESLAEAVEVALDDPAGVRAMGEAGRRTVEGMRGALPETLRHLDPYLASLRLAGCFESRDR